MEFENKERNFKIATEVCSSSLHRRAKREMKQSFKRNFRHASADKLLELRTKIITNPESDLDFESKQLFNNLLEEKGLEHYAI